MPGLQTASTHTLPGALRLPGLQRHQQHPARWRYAYRAYKRASTHILPGGTALTGPTNGINPYPARWRYAYWADKWHRYRRPDKA
ncbi:hypothetical protein AL497_25910 [Klebsiella aerogenes]|nr:hypothetical protein AL497_25910 [Klebsiella aerogenes]AUZ16978.1 hypothetical protein AL511_26400 [Klebsiella aerogenes]AVF00842.1 hypothetical protein AM441_20375 [Klebsiella aerogenes]AXY30320.1 hypothetical protein CEQ05_19310 [Klebsiella aerogenes]PNF06032.1 hypothetical protein A6J70_12965 [Klebsiella aerogenes]